MLHLRVSPSCGRTVVTFVIIFAILILLPFLFFAWIDRAGGINGPENNVGKSADTMRKEVLAEGIELYLGDCREVI